MFVDTSGGWQVETVNNVNDASGIKLDGWHERQIRRKKNRKIIKDLRAKSEVHASLNILAHPSSLMLLYSLSIKEIIALWEELIIGLWSWSINVLDYSIKALTDD